MSVTPVVGVILRCYNNESTIIRAIDSVASQSYGNINLTIIDDCSTDNSVEMILKRIEAVEEIAGAIWNGVLHPHVQVTLLRMPKVSGRAAIGNAGMLSAWDDSDAFLLLDGNDYLLAEKANRSVSEYLKSPSTIGIVGSDYVETDMAGLSKRVFGQPYVRWAMCIGNIVPQMPLVAKRAVDRAGKFDESLTAHEDYDLWLRISEFLTIVHIPESLAVKQADTQSISKELWNANYQVVQRKMASRAAGN